MTAGASILCKMRGNVFLLCSIISTHPSVLVDWLRRLRSKSILNTGFVDGALMVKMLTLKKTIIFVVVTILLVVASVQAVKVSRQLEKDFADSIRSLQGDK